MSHSTPKPTVCRRLVFDDEEPLPGSPESAAVADPRSLPEAVIPPNLKEACMDNIQNLLVEELRHSRDSSKIKWNFDFEQEMPLEGNWEWERIEPRTDNSNNTNFIDQEMENNQTKV